MSQEEWKAHFEWMQLEREAMEADLTEATRQLRQSEEKLRDYRFSVKLKRGECPTSRDLEGWK